ncbi:helix-turn-helix domain-containing protein, partial [Clostridium tyrobutyricum]|uniref:helix-turn-helix domain-containing protein n=1 Tax=Clostridium tyrobutyricum TaxID=1519 RepID=UPI0020CB63ED
LELCSRLYNNIMEVGILDNIGEKIKEERIKKGLKQYELAKKAGISNTYLSDLEVGRTAPSIKTLDKLSKALEVDIKIFL